MRMRLKVFQWKFKGTKADLGPPLVLQTLP